MEQDDLCPEDHRAGGPGDHRSFADDVGEAEHDELIQQSPDVSARDRDRITVVEYRLKFSSVMRDAGSLGEFLGPEQRVVDASDGGGMMVIDRPDHIDGRDLFGPQVFIITRESQQFARRIEGMRQANAIVATVMFQTVESLVQSSQEIFVFGPQGLETMVELEVDGLVFEVLRQFVVLELQFLPPAGDGGDPAGRTDDFGRFTQHGAETLRSKKHHVRHRPVWYKEGDRLSVVSSHMHVIFVEPCFPANQRRFVDALTSVGAHVTGIGEAAAASIPGSVREALHDYIQVGSVCHEESMLDAVRRVQATGWVDRLEATVEAHILPIANVREACTIPGTSVRTAFLCRDKPAMKQVLRDAEIPCAQSAGVSSPEEARAFAERVGYPIILKPRAGAGAAGTERIDDDQALENAIKSHGIVHGQSVAAEEFIEGHEGFYDALCVDGQVVHEFISHYYPGVLEAMRHRWISPYLVTTNRLDEPGYEEVRQLGARVIRELGIETSAVHMEWFFGPRGLKFSEIGCRPPGVGVWDIYSAANDLDLYREWAHAVTHGTSEATPSRRYAAGLIALRPEADGRILGYDGVEEIQRAYGEWIIDAHLPPAGTGTQPIEAGYMANAWLRLRHPDYDTLRGMLDTIGETITVMAG